MQVMSVWPFKQMILRAQLKQSHIPAAQSQSPDRGSNTGSTSASASSSSSSAQSASIVVPHDLVQQKLSGGGASSVQSAAEPASKLPAESAATPAGESGQAEDGGHVGSGSHEADVKKSPGMPHNMARAAGEPLQTDYLFHFGDTTEIRKAFEMPNRLTG